MSDPKIGRERYVNLGTFRRSGKEVPTPVWIADGESGGESVLYIYTNRRSGKVKRIRANGRVRLAPCDARGGLRGDWLDARARMIDNPAEAERGFAAIIAKYGWQMQLALFASRFTGRYADRTIIELRLDRN
jgi:PPOX class probable F420-dependent enzyme